MADIHCGCCHFMDEFCVEADDMCDGELMGEVSVDLTGDPDMPYWLNKECVDKLFKAYIKKLKGDLKTEAHYKMDSTSTKENLEAAEKAYQEFQEHSVDDHDAPNIYPYKMCSCCSERSSCGAYNDNKQWVCEDCQFE